MNKDEAIKCFEISKKKYQQGDTAGALKFVRKSLRLFELPRASELEKELEDLSKSQSQSHSKSHSKSNSNTTRNTSKAKKSGNSNIDSDEFNVKSDFKSDSKSEKARPFTPDQVKGIKRILEKKSSGDLYGVLGLEKGCSDNEIKKAYRKAALLYHPDKCGAPGTDDAFKAISHAWTVLGDAEKKNSYDRFGVDSEASGGRQQNPFQGFQGFGGQRRGYDSEITPEDLLRMFMGGGGGPGFAFQTNGFGFQTNGGPGFGGRQRFRTRQGGAARAERPDTASTILQFLPVILLVLMSFFSIFGSEDDPFSFHKSYDYSVQKETMRHNVKYYVNPRQYSRKFDTLNKKSNLETRVERIIFII